MEPIKKEWGYRSLGVIFLAGLGQWAMIQKDVPWTLWVGLVLFAAAGLLLLVTIPSSSPSFSLIIGRKTESCLFLIILTLGIFLRAKGANQFPNGLFADRAEVACQALRILRDHWRPGLETLSFHVPEWCIYYFVAGWFYCFGTSVETFAYFDVVLSALGLFFTYTAFRQVLNVRACLLGFFLLAVMRWNFVYAHQIYFQSETVLFFFLAMTFLFFALRKNHWVAAFFGGVVLAGGLYSYQALKIAPFFFLCLMIFEWIRDPKTLHQNRRIWFLFWAVFLCFSLPFLNWMLENGRIGRREIDASIFSKMHIAPGMSFAAALADNFRYLLLLFNRLGAYNTQADFQLHRMLDDFTGPLFVLAIFYALRRAAEKPFFLLLTGVGIMSLPALFSEYGGNPGRLLGITPFVAYLAALFLADWFEHWIEWCGDKKIWRWSGTLVLILILAGAAFENYYDYFVRQTSDPACQNDFSWPESKVGRLIQQSSENTEIFLPALFYGNPTIGYLSYPRWDHFHLLDLSNLPQPKDFPAAAHFLFFEDELKAGSMEFLQKVYPGMRTASYENPLGQVKVYSGVVDPNHLNGVIKVERGLWGEYHHDEQQKPFMSRRDPVVNFSYSDLSHLGAPLNIHWSGWFRVARSGNFNFWVMTLPGGRARLLVDGKGSLGFISRPQAVFSLIPGKHHLDLYFQQGSEPFSTVSLFWKEPGEREYRLMPNDTFSFYRRN